MSGTATAVDDFLRRSLYVRPQTDFAGYTRVDVEMLSGVHLNYGADACKVTLPVLVTDVFDDAPAFTGSLGETGMTCTAGSEGCALEDLGVADPDCPRAVDGSCYLRLSLNASAGGLLLLGRSMVPASNISDFKGHGPGLNAMLQRVRYVPPAVQPSGGVVEIFALLERIVLPTNATPAELQSASAVLAIQVSTPMADMAPTLRRDTGESFHGSVFVVHGPQPFVIDDIVFEYYGTGGAVDKVLITLEVSDGYLFLGTTDGIWLEDGSAEGTSRLKFRASSTDLASLYLSDVRYSWDESQCASIVQFNATVDDGLHEPWPLRSLLQLENCTGYNLEWSGDPVQVEEDSQASVTGINITTFDDDVFLLVDVKHPPNVLGDCRLTFNFSEALEPFEAGRECHLDGTVADLNRTLSLITYRPPPNWFGQLELQVVVQRVRLEDAVSQPLSSLSPVWPAETLPVVVEVTGVNDRPLLDIYQDRQALPEDPGEPVLLSPLFVTDVDAGSSPLEITFDLAEGHADNRLHMCDLFRVDILEPLEHRLDGDGCLPGGASRVRLQATLEAFNSMQDGEGRLRFLPAKDWHGAVLVNITVDDLGSGLGENVRQTESRALHLAVEPAVDPPIVSFLCDDAAPLVSYGSACLEVRGCLELSAGVDSLDEDISMWLSISISEPGAAISMEDAAPVRVWDEGTSSVRVLGLYQNVRDSLGALVIRPPPGLFSGKEDPDVFSYEISVAVVALGQLFNEPLPSAFENYPNDSLTFSVEFRRVNQAPIIFSDIDHFSASQLNPSVGLPGLFVLDADAQEDDLVEVTFEVDPTSAGGAVSFAGGQDLSITRRITLADLNKELQGLSFIFQDDSWFGVTALTVSVSDLGNRGWNVKGYNSARHQETRPQVLSLRGGSVSLLPDETYQYFSLFSGDFTWEVFCKRLAPNLTDTTLGTTAPLFTQPSSATPAPDIIFRNLPLDVDVNGSDSGGEFMYGADGNGSNVSGPPVVSLEIDADGYPTVLLRSDAGHEVFERGRTRLAVGVWHHLALVVRRASHAEAPGRPSDTTLGEVVLYVDGAADASWTVAAGRAAFVGPASGGVLALAGGGAGSSGGVALSRARLWGRALPPSELAACSEAPRPACEDDDAGAIAMAHLLGETVHGCADIGDMCSNPVHGPTVRSTCCQTCSLFEADAGAGRPQAALAFLFGGSLAEESGRTAARPVGSWSFDLDAPPPCLGLNQWPFDSLFEYCVCYDRSLDEDSVDPGDAGYVWHSPQAYAAMTSGMGPYANNLVRSSFDEGQTVSILLSVHRYFVNRPPSIALLEPASGVLSTLEDHPSFVVLEVSHQAAEQMVPRPLAVALSTEHGRVRSLSTAAAIRLAFDRRRVEYRAPLHELNEFLSQLEYTPDPNYAGNDTLFITVTDLEFTINASVPVVVSPLSDPLTVVCPPGIDVLEGSQVNPIGANFSVHDGDQLPGHSDEGTRVEVRLSVGGGSLRMLPGALAGSASLQRLLLSAGNGVDLESLMNDTFAAVPAIVFETTIGGLRDILGAVAFTPYPVLFHGVVHLGLEVTVIDRGESARCDVGIVVHPVNSPPAIHVDGAQLTRALGRPTMSPQRNVSLEGVFLISDPDEEDFFGWFADRVHSGRLELNVTCGSLSFGEYGDRDYVNGAQHGSIAGREGMTFYAGDGSRDPRIDALSTLKNLNYQLQRLRYYSEACRSMAVALTVEFSDLGNFGEGGSLIANAELIIEIADW